jgi:CRISPR type I-E-associated protein CasB/Cse2
LRRARSSLEALLVKDAITLARRLGVASATTMDWRVQAALDLSRVLAHVREHEPATHPMRAAGWKRFAGNRKETDAGGDRPNLTEARFKRLMQTGDGEEKVDAFVRLVVFLGRCVKVDDLATDFLSWNHPTYGDRVREKWAFYYYAAQDAAPRGSTASPDHGEDDAE